MQHEARFHRQTVQKFNSSDTSNRLHSTANGLQGSHTWLQCHVHFNIILNLVFTF